MHGTVNMGRTHVNMEDTMRVQVTNGAFLVDLKSAVFFTTSWEGGSLKVDT